MINKAEIKPGDIFTLSGKKWNPIWIGKRLQCIGIEVDDGITLLIKYKILDTVTVPYVENTIHIMNAYQDEGYELSVHIQHKAHLPIWF